MVLDREQTLASWDGVPPWADYRIDDERAVGLGVDTVAVTYRVSASRTGTAPYRAQLTSVYVRRDGHWRLALHQQTPQL
jgi:hypothetical protein